MKGKGKREVFIASVVGGVTTGPELQRLLLDPRIWTLGETISVTVESVERQPKKGKR